jgi:thymidylate synthase (FAD)
MKVKLLTHTPDPERLIATAAKLCYSSSDIDDISVGLTDEKIKSFLDMLMSIGHESPLEHVTFTFAIEGISRSCSHQLVRHRIASYSQKSQRYVDENQFEYVTPPYIEHDVQMNALFQECMHEIQNVYEKLRNGLTAYHETVLNHKTNPVDAHKQSVKLANEDARFVLPNACTTSVMVTMNIRTLFNFFKHRCCNRAQWEIREMAELMYRECVKVCPNIFKHAGPSCYVTGKCPEGKMTCGEMKSMYEKYDRLNGNDIKYDAL